MDIEDFKFDDYILEHEINDMVKRLQNYSVNQVFQIFNCLVMTMNFESMNKSGSEISVKLLNNLFPIYTSNAKDNKDNGNLDLTKEIEFFKKKLSKMYNYYYDITNYDKYNIEDTFPINNITGRAFMAYHFDYPHITDYQYIEILRSNINVLDKRYEKYSLSGEEVISGFGICIYFEIVCKKDFFAHLNYLKYKLSDKYTFKGYFTSFPRKLLSSQLNKYGVPGDKFINCFFEQINFSESENISIVYPIANKDKDKPILGIRTKDRVFFPRSYHNYNKLWTDLIESDEMLSIKDDLTQKYTARILKSFFGNENVFEGLYDENGAEHDIIILYKDTVLNFECKSAIFKEPFREPSKSIMRLKHNFDRSIQEGYNQCCRLRKRVLSKNAKYYDSDKLNKKLILDLNNFNNVLMTVVTLNSYLNLAGSLHMLIKLKENDSTYPWVVDIFSLEHIVNKCKLEFNKEYFINYLSDRINAYDSVESIAAEELDYFGYYTRYGKFYSLGKYNAFMTLGPGYASFVLDYLYKS